MLKFRNWVLPQCFLKNVSRIWEFFWGTQPSSSSSRPLFSHMTILLFQHLISQYSFTATKKCLFLNSQLQLHLILLSYMTRILRTKGLFASIRVACLIYNGTLMIFKIDYSDCCLSTRWVRKSATLLNADLKGTVVNRTCPSETDESHKITTTVLSSLSPDSLSLSLIEKCQLF